MEAKITKLDGEFKTKKSVFYDVELENIPFEEGKRVKIKLDLEDAEGIKVGDAIKYKVDYNAKSASGNPYILVTLDKPEPEKPEPQPDKTETTTGTPKERPGVTHALPKTREEQILIIQQTTLSSLVNAWASIPPAEREKFVVEDRLKTYVEAILKHTKTLLKEGA